MVENFKFYKSIHEMVKNLNDRKYSAFMKEVCLVQFYEKHIDEVVFEDELLSAIWGGAKVQIKKQLDGYCSIKKIRYDGMFEGAYQGATKGAYQQPQSKSQSKSQPQSQSQYVAGLNEKAFNMWIEYKGSAYTKQGKTLSMNKLAKYDTITQQQMVENSIMNGWKGLIEPKQQKPIKSGNTTNDTIDKFFAQQNKGEIIDARIN